MWMKLEIIQRTLLWLAGVALPATPVLQHRLKFALRAIIFAVSGALILSGLVITALYAAFGAMVSQGTNPLLAFGLLAAFALVLGGSLILLAMRDISNVAHIKDDLTLFPKASSPAASDPLKAMAEQIASLKSASHKGGTGVRDIASAFVDGLMNGSPQTATTRSHTPVATADVEIKATHRGNGLGELHIERHPHQEEQPFL